MALSTEASFVLGMVGAAAPEILRLYELRTRPQDFKWSWSYLFLTIPFLVLGGLVAVILPTTTWWGAFYAGLSMPITLTAASKKVMDLSTVGGQQPQPAVTLPASVRPRGNETRPKGRPTRQPADGFRAFIQALF